MSKRKLIFIFLFISIFVVEAEAKKKFDLGLFIQLYTHTPLEHREKFVLEELRKYPKEPCLYYYLARHYYDTVKENKNHFYQAEKYYKKAIELDSEYLQAMNGLGAVYIDMKEYSKAEELFKRIISIDAEFSPVYVNYGIMRYYQGKYEGAVEYFNKATRMDISKEYLSRYEKFILASFLGRTYDEIDDDYTAEEYYKKALELNPEDIYTMHNLGTIYMRRKDYAQAGGLFKEIISIDEGYAPVYISYGLLRYYQKRWEEAIEFFKTGLVLDKSLDNQWTFIRLRMEECYEKLNLTELRK